MNNHSNEDFINVLHFSSSNQQGSVDNELLKAQVYLAKADKGDRWWYSLAIIFVQLPEGDERIEFVKKYLSDKMFGKKFLSSYKLGEACKKKENAGVTPLLVTEYAAHQTEMRGKDLAGIISYFSYFLNASASESLLAHLLVSQSIGHFCKGKTLPFIYSQASLLFAAGLIDETIESLKYANMPFGDDDLLFEFIKGGFNDSWKGVEMPITQYIGFVPREMLDRLANYYFDKRRLNNAFSSKAMELAKAGYGHHSAEEIIKIIEEDKQKELKRQEELERQNELEKQEKLEKMREDSRINRIISFVTKGEMDDDSIDKDEVTELSDVLQHVMENFSYDEQDFIFQTLLDKTTGETFNYITKFLEAKMEEDDDNVPYNTARYLAIECDSETALEYLSADADPEDDPMLAFHLIAAGMFEFDNDYDFLRKFLENCPDPEEMNWLETEFPGEFEDCSYEAAVAYYHNADFEKALFYLINGIDRIEDLYGIEGDGYHFLIKILSGLIEEHPHNFESVIYDIIGDWSEDICNICVNEEAYSMALRIYAMGKLENKHLLEDILVHIPVDARSIDANCLQQLIYEENFETIKLGMLAKKILSPEDCGRVKEQLVSAMDKIDDLPKKVSFATMLLRDLGINDEKIVKFLVENGEDCQQKVHMMEQCAAEDKYAQQYLANHYRQTSNLKAALPWLMESVENGMPDELDELNTAKQFGAYITAAKQCDESVASWVRDRLAEVYSQLPDGDEKLLIAKYYRSWLDVDAKDQIEKIAKLGDADATFDLYKQDHSIKTLRTAARLGSAEAQYQLGVHLLKLHDATPVWKKAVKVVKGTKTNKQKAKEWFEKAAKQGHKGAIKMLK